MRVLKQGSSGDDVARWQTFLLGQGALDIVADGSFGPKTAEATKIFQKAHGLGPDGIVGRGTIAKALDLGFGELEEDDPSEDGPHWPPKPPSPPLSSTERATLFGSFRYQAAPIQGNPEGITILDDWASKNIVSVEVPQLRGVLGAPPSGKVFFHKAGADRLVGLFQAWDDAGLLPLVLSWGGSWVPRFIRGSRTILSNHATGVAFDVNAAWNPLGAQPALRGQKGSVRDLVPLAFEAGFYWGGHFSRQDGMHFELYQ